MIAAPIVIAAGGTGGHVFPAQALAQALAARGWPLALVTDRRGGGFGEGWPAAEHFTLRAGALAGRGLIGRLRGMIEMLFGIAQARRLLRGLMPAAVVGFGGYPSVPPLLAARALGRRTVIHEANAILGRANRRLAPRVTAIATAFPETGGLRDTDRGKTTVTGNPVRPEIAAARAAGYAPPEGDSQLRLLVFGGSQGAAVFSRIVPAALASLPEPLRMRLNVVQQCRHEDHAAVSESYASSGIFAELAGFFADMPQRLASAHLVICRAGASTVAELAAVGRPALLVPYPHAIDDHQTANAAALAAAGGAWLVPEPTFTTESVAARIAELAAAPHRMTEAAAAARRLGHADAAERLADLVEAVAGQRAP